MSRMLRQIINVYCDESCHLERDHQPVMVLGALSCPAEKAREVADRIREIKRDHGMKAGFEVKWSKVSRGGVQFYLALINYFFDDDDLCFRGVIIPNKAQLNHEAFGHDHDTWYYKMYYTLLKRVLDPEKQFRIYLDIKDTRSAKKVAKLHEVLANSIHDFELSVVTHVQNARSEEIEQLQLVDLLVGVVSYVNRGLIENAGKVALVKRVQEKSHYSLTQTTWLSARKVNLLRWMPRIEE